MLGRFGRRDMLRIVKIMLILTVGIWSFIGAFGNLDNWHGVVASVKSTTSMSTWPGGDEDWRATNNPILIYVGAAMIPVAKLLSGILCFAGARRMWSARAASGRAFELAKTLSLAGCGIALLMLFAGWIVIADTWFQGWRSETLRNSALGTAFRYVGFVGLIALFVAIRDDVDDD